MIVRTRHLASVLIPLAGLSLPLTGVHGRFDADVKSGDPGDYVRTGGPQTGYQHLVVDRGSIGPSQILFRQ